MGLNEVILLMKRRAVVFFSKLNILLSFKSMHSATRMPGSKEGDEQSQIRRTRTIAVIKSRDTPPAPPPPKKYPQKYPQDTPSKYPPK